MKFYLIVARGRQQGLPIPVKVDLFMLGSAQLCQLRSSLPGIGPQHCALVNRQRKLFVRDLGSGEPTLLNGAMVPPNEEWPVHPGDRLEVGPLEFVLQFREKPISRRNLEEWALRCLDQDSDREYEAPIEELQAAERRPRATNPADAAAQILGRLQAKRGLVLGRLRIGQDGDVTIVRFNDRHLVEKSEIALVKKELWENLASASLRVLLDFRNVSRLSTAGMTMLEELHAWLKLWGSTLAMCRIRREIQGILQSLQFAHDVPIFHDRRAALATDW